MKRLVVPFVLFALLSGCAVVPYAPGYETYQTYPAYPVYPYPAQPVYAAPVYVEPPVSFSFDFLFGGGHRGHGGWRHRH
jgi:hypothetical protein